MKKIFRKNQLIITALALMIAVAGYFSYMNNNISDEEAATQASVNADELEEDFEISNEDILSEGEIFVAEDTQTEEGVETASGDDVAAGADILTEDVAAEQGAEETTGEIENPGETVLTSTSVSNIDYASQMKLNREQIRSKNKATLLEIVNNTSISDDLKQDAINRMIAMTDIAERENAAELLLEAKGFTDIVVSITDENCDVVLNMGEVTDAKRAQVEDIVKRKTNIAADHIVITPISIDETADAE